MNFWEHFWKAAESFGVHFWERFNIFALLFLLCALIAAHAFMMHAGRPPEMIRWVENLIGGVVTALIAILAGTSKPSNGVKP